MSCLLCRCKECRKARAGVLADMLRAKIVQRETTRLAAIDAWRDTDADNLARAVVDDMARAP